MSRRKMTNEVTEIPVTANALTRSILEYLALMGIKAWRNNTGILRPQRSNGTHGFVRFGAVGSGDILGVMRGGRFLSIEVKAGRDQIRPAQQEWIDDIETLGGVAFVARNLDDVIVRIEKELA